MASKQEEAGNDQLEYCEHCRRRTGHEVTIDIRTESDDPEGAAFSREPYRVTRCARCGTEHAQRMNHV